MALTTAPRVQPVRDLYRVHRLEYPFPVAYLCHVTWGAGYAVASFQELARPSVWLAVLANLVPLIAQNVLNAAVDIPVDVRTAGKTGIAEAALRLGRSRLIFVASAEMAVALVLVAGVACHLGRPLVAAAVAVAAGILVEYLYNLEPVRLKKRGLANPLALGDRGFTSRAVGAPAVGGHGAVQQAPRSCQTPHWPVVPGSSAVVHHLAFQE